MAEAKRSVAKRASSLGGAGQWASLSLSRGPASAELVSIGGVGAEGVDAGGVGAGGVGAEGVDAGGVGAGGAGTVGVDAGGVGAGGWAWTLAVREWALA